MARKILYVMRGLPGSGKSTRAKKIHTETNHEHHPSKLFSTDDYWMRPDGTYDFNYYLLVQSHVWNQRRVARAIAQHTENIIVDNVNISCEEIKPYALLAKEYEYKVILVEADTEWAMDVEECYKRNTHGVPYPSILRMYHAWEESSGIYCKLKQLGVKV